MSWQRAIYAYLLGIGIFLAAISVHSVDKCSAVFANTPTVNYESISDPKKIRLIEASLGRKLKVSEVGRILQAMHLTSKVSVDDYQAKYHLVQSVIPKDVFHQLFVDGVMSFPAPDLSLAAVQQKQKLISDLNLTASDIQVIDRYSADLYFQINRASMDGLVARRLVDALVKLPIFAGTVYRGVDPQYAKGFFVGQKLESDHFWSTSTDAAVARDWIDGGLVLVIQTSSGRALGSLARYPTELEVTILPGTKFDVWRIDGKTVYLKEHEPNGSNT